MKKIFVMVVILAMVGFAASAFSAATIDGSTTIGGGNFAPSTNVAIDVASAPTSYAATSAHLNGSFEYGTGGGDAYTGDASKIVKQAYTASSTVNPTAPTDATSLSGDGWG